MQEVKVEITLKKPEEPEDCKKISCYECVYNAEWENRGYKLDECLKVQDGKA